MLTNNMCATPVTLIVLAGAILSAIFVASSTTILTLPAFPRLDYIIRQRYKINEILSDDVVHAKRNAIPPCIEQLADRFDSVVLDSALLATKGSADDVCIPDRRNDLAEQLIKVSICYENIGYVLEAIRNCVRHRRARVRTFTTAAKKVLGVASPVNCSHLDL